MGSSQASGYAECVGEGLCSLEVAVQAHLQSNCYPPLPARMARACLYAIKNVEMGKEQRRVLLPEGMEYGLGGKASRLIPSWRLVEAAHLDAFVQYKEE